MKTIDHKDKFLNPAFEIKSLNEAGEFSGYASVFNVVDLHKDIIEPGAFSKSLNEWQQLNKWPKMLWQHDPSCPIGRWICVKQDSTGLHVKGQLLLDVAKGYEAYQLLKAGVLDGLSIGFKVKKARFDAATKTRILQEICLQEISLVTFAANVGATVLDVKDAHSQNTIQKKIESLIRCLKAPK